MDGIWSSWSEWVNCSHDTTGYCGELGRVIRNRTCTEPAPKLNGNYCPGNHSMVNTVGK